MRPCLYFLIDVDLYDTTQASIESRRTTNRSISITHSKRGPEHLASRLSLPISFCYSLSLATLVEHVGPLMIPCQDADMKEAIGASFIFRKTTTDSVPFFTYYYRKSQSHARRAAVCPVPYPTDISSIMATE